MSPQANPRQPTEAPRVAAVLCAVMETEVEAALRDHPGIVGTVNLPQGLHNEPDKLRIEVQKAIDQLERDTDCDAIVLVYGLCSRGTEGVVAARAKLVIPRAHDCITLLLGSKERYAQYVAKNPGTYWYSPGWNRHHTPPGPERYNKLLQEYVEKYGEDNAEFLMEQEQSWFSHYDRATYVHLTVGKTEQDVGYTRDCADWLGWNYDEQTGDPQLLRDLLHGHWDNERFLVLEPGQTLQMTSDASVVKAVDAASKPTERGESDT